ncbi:cytochrome-c peroxidase [Flavobacteriales bacterium 34_180_T64]|nr:cytochrome-c peroxidase [Flavobacteriales bacterium 34_180_T64]
MKSISLTRISVILVIIVMSSCATDDGYVRTENQSNLEQRIIELYGSKDALILPLSNDYSNIPSDINNPITAAKVELGKMLFHETGIALNAIMDEGMTTYSCASCHHADAGFQSGLQQGIAEGGSGFGLKGEGRTKSSLYLEVDLDIQPIRNPSVLNVAYQDVMFWNGQFGGTGTNFGTESSWTEGTPKEINNLGFEGVETQAIAGADAHRFKIEAEFIENSSYKELFDNAFPDIIPEERYTKLNGALAIAAYERTLLPNQAPFQLWLKGDESAMSSNEVEGALLFFNQAKCFNCHTGPGLNGMSFHALGMNDLEGDNIMTIVDEATKKGRGGFTNNPEDDFKFKTPQLYNLKDVTFYGHGGTFQSVEDVVRYKSAAIGQNQDVPANELSEMFVPLNLSETQINQITAFLELALYDNNLQRYSPDTLPTGSCFPNADAQSSIDLGCN